MKIKIVIYFIILVFLDTICQISQKQLSYSLSNFNKSNIFDVLFEIITSPWIYIIISTYIFIVYFYLSILEKMQLGSLYAAIHLNIVTLLLVSILFFGDSLSYGQIFGAFFIIAGVIIFLYTEIC